MPIRDSRTANVEMLSAELLKREARFDRVHQKLHDNFLDLFKMVGGYSRNTATSIQSYRPTSPWSIS